MKTYLSNLRPTLQATCCLLTSVALIAVVLLGASSANARQEEKKAEPPKTPATGSVEYKTEAGRIVTTVVEGLNNPTSVVMQPETGIVFVADSGNGQVVRIVNGKAEPIVTEFPKDSLATTPSLNIGPLSLAFLNRENLIVGSGGQPAGVDAVKLYSISAATKFDAPKLSLNLVADEPQSQPAEGNFFGLAVAPNAIFTTSQGDAAKGWISVTMKTPGESLSGLARHIASSEATGVATPTAITITPHGYLLAANVGSLGTEKDSVLAFYETASKKMLMKLDTGLMDISAIAYSPRRQMYALDMAWSQPESGGLYRIVEDKTVASGLRTKLICKLPHPTSMSFDGDGGVYVTLRGEVDDKGNSKGSLVRIPSEENL